jgi:uncharacterized protein
VFELNRVLAAAREGPLAKSPVHGERHWLAVAAAGLDLCELTPAADPVVVFLFGLLHDCRRITETAADDDHGRRAAQLARQLVRDGALGLDDARLDLLSRACREHTAARTTANPTLGACFDADRLNLWRVAVAPSPRLLSTTAAKDAAAIAGSGLYCPGESTWDELAHRATADLAQISPGPSGFLARWRSSGPEIRENVLAGRKREAQAIFDRNRATSTLEEAVAARDWVEALSHRPASEWTTLAAGWMRERVLTRVELRDLAIMLWLGATPVPVGRAIDAYRWASIWSAVGFYSNAGHARPRFPLKVYRGVVADNGAFGMSWTPNRNLANLFAVARSAHRPGAVYQLELQPDEVLAILEPENPMPHTVEQMNRLGRFVEIIVYPDAVDRARLLETTRPTQPFRAHGRLPTLGESFQEEAARMLRM